MEADVIALGKEVDRLEKQEALDRELSKQLNAPLTGKLTVPGMDTKTGKISNEYKKGFWNVRCSKNSHYDIVSALHVGAYSEGGSLVLAEFEYTLDQSLEGKVIFRKLSNIIHTSSGDHKISVVAMHGSAS